jgi:hypothetical protein
MIRATCLGTKEITTMLQTPPRPALVLHASGALLSRNPAARVNHERSGGSHGRLSADFLQPVLESALTPPPAPTAPCGRFETRSVILSVGYAAIGFSPIGALTLSIAGVLPLNVGAALLVGLAIIAALVLAGWFPTYHQLALEGFAAGLLAVLLYDFARWTTITFGWWGDFIPAIGGWLLGTNQPDAFVGYLFRWLGDGGGMGLAFVVAARSLVPGLTRSPAIGLGILYGVAIWACLVMTLIAVPRGQSLLFPLTPATFAMSLGGHLIYGGVLGAWLSLNPGSIKGKKGFSHAL